MRFSFLIPAILPIFTLAQIPYGNNPAAGHYCNTRGVRLYYEMYGQGEPLLIWQHIPKAWLWIVPHSGHATLIGHRDEFEKNVLAFFRSK